MHSEIVRDARGNRRGVPDDQFFIREISAYRGHSDVSGFGEDYRGEGRCSVAGVSITELEKPGVAAYVLEILLSATRQCSSNRAYVREVAAHRQRITKLQRQEARSAAIQQAILNRPKKSA